MRLISLSLAPGYGLNTGEVDKLLIDLSRATWTSPKILWLAGNNESRSIASDNAVSVLEGIGVRVTTK